MTSEPDRPLIRTVHLLGGLRAYDVPSRGVEIGQEGQVDFKFQNVPYSHLYKVLKGYNLTPIGVSFIEFREQITGIHPADFEMLCDDGFSAMTSSREWSNVGHFERRKQNITLASLSIRISTYLRLLTRRLFQVSEAYYRACYEPRRDFRSTGKGLGLGFENQWTWELQTTIHGFLADAATLRDVLAEAVWYFFGEPEKDIVLSMGKLIKVAKGIDQKFVQEFLVLGKGNGWMKNLTEIRNHTTHVVPLNMFHELFLSYLRPIQLDSSREVATMHCPLTTENWQLRKDAHRFANFDDPTSYMVAMKAYKDFVEVSGDALEYCWLTLQNFARWSEKLRIEVNAKAKTPIISASDLR